MMNLRSRFSLFVFFIFCLTALMLVGIKQQTSAAEFELSFGIFQPNNNVALFLYGSSPTFKLQMNNPIHQNLDWIVSCQVIDFVNESNKKDKLSLVSLQTGFEQRLGWKTDSSLNQITPYVGAGLTLSSGFGSSESYANDTINGWSIYKEIGLQIHLSNESTSELVFNIKQFELQNNPITQFYFEGTEFTMGLRTGF